MEDDNSNTRTPRITELFGHTPKINKVPDTTWGDAGRDARNGAVSLVTAMLVYTAPFALPLAGWRLGRASANAVSSTYTQAVDVPNYIREHNLTPYEFRDERKQQRESNKVLKELSREINAGLLQEGVSSSRFGPAGLRQHKRAAIEVQSALNEGYGAQLLDLTAEQKTALKNEIVETIRNDRPNGMLWGKSFPSKEDLQASAQSGVVQHKKNIGGDLEEKAAAKTARNALIKNVVNALEGKSERTFTAATATKKGQEQRYHVAKAIRKATADLSAEQISGLADRIVENIQEKSAPKRSFFSSTASPYFPTVNELRLACTNAISGASPAIAPSAPSVVVYAGAPAKTSQADRPAAPQQQPPRYTLEGGGAKFYVTDNEQNTSALVTKIVDNGSSRELETANGQSFLQIGKGKLTLLEQTKEQGLPSGPVIAEAVAVAAPSSEPAQVSARVSGSTERAAPPPKPVKPERRTPSPLLAGEAAVVGVGVEGTRSRSNSRE